MLPSHLTSAGSNFLSLSSPQDSFCRKGSHRKKGPLLSWGQIQLGRYSWAGASAHGRKRPGRLPKQAGPRNEHAECSSLRFMPRVFRAHGLRQGATSSHHHLFLSAVIHALKSSGQSLLKRWQKLQARNHAAVSCPSTQINTPNVDKLIGEGASALRAKGVLSLEGNGLEGLVKSLPDLKQ